MKPTPAREILRDRTAYTLGRTLAGVLLAVSLLGSVGLVILALNGHAILPGDAASMIYLACVVAFVNCVSAVLLYELAQAWFDSADAALTRCTVESMVLGEAESD